MSIINVVPKTLANATPAKVGSAQATRERAINRFNDGLKAASAAPVIETPATPKSPAQAATPPNNTSVPSEATQETPAEAPSSPVEASQETDKAPTTDKTSEEPLSTQYAVLARKEKAIRAKAQEAKAKEDALLAREAAIKAKEASYANPEVSLKDRILKDPITVLNELGITYDQLTNHYADSKLPAEESAQAVELKAIKEELKRIQDEQQNTKKSFEDSQTKAYNQAVDQIRADTAKLVASNPDFEAIHTTGSVEDVVELIKTTFKEDGILLTVEEAAKEVEEEIMLELRKVQAMKKLQQKQVAAPSDPAKSSGDSVKPPNVTLTNALGNSAKLSARDRAIAAFENKLQK